MQLHYYTHHNWIQVFETERLSNYHNWSVLTLSSVCHRVQNATVSQCRDRATRHRLPAAEEKEGRRLQRPKTVHLHTTGPRSVSALGNVKHWCKLWNKHLEHIMRCSLYCKSPGRQEDVCFGGWGWHCRGFPQWKMLACTEFQSSPTILAQTLIMQKEQNQQKWRKFLGEDNGMLSNRLLSSHFYF